DLNEVAQGPLTENLSGKNKPNYTDHSVNMVYTVPNALPNTDFLFSYDLSKNEDMAGCPTCSYKLTVQVTGTNNEPISVSVTSSLPFGSDAGSDLSKGIVVNSFGMSDVCANTSTKLAFTFNAVDIGNYTISKTLQLLPFEITPALLSQIQTSYGVPSLANLLAEAEGTADTSVCNPANQPSTGPLVSNAINSVTKAECQSLLTQMRSEVMPASEAPASGTDFCGVVDGHYYHGPNTNTFWTNVSDHYSSLKNHLAGIPSSVLDGPQLVAYVIDVNNWQDSWADTLVRYHPEYCRYLACEALRTSHEYDDNMAVVQKYSAGNALGYTDCTNDPLKNADVSSFCNANMTTVANDFCNALAHYNQFLSSSTTGLGSILASSGASNAAYTSTDLANFTNFLDAPGTSFTLADCMDPTKNVFFDGTTYIIANNPNSTTNINPLYQNVDVNDPLAVDQQRWKLFRGAYSAIKQKIIDDEIYHACGCDYLHDAYADDASTQCPYIVVKDPNLQGNNNAYCEEVKKETVKYWLSQIEQRVESVCSTFVVPPANPTATIDIDNQAVLDLITAKLNAFWGTDDQFCNEPIIMVNNAQVAASPLADIPTLTASLKDASGQACSTALLTPSDHCEDRVAAWMDKVESIMTNRSSGCADAFHNGYLCDYTIPGITCPNSVKIKDYINDRFVGYCANNSNILNENIMLTHDAIQTDPDLQKIEVLMQIMGCSNLHEVVAQEPLNQNNCPQPDPCAEAMFSFMNLNVFNHSSTYFPTTGSINASTLPVMDNCDADVPGGKFFPDNQLSGGAFFSFTATDPNLTSTSSVTDYMSQYNFVFLDQCGKPISVNDIAQINYTEVLVDQAGPGADLSAFSSIQGIQGCVLFSRLVCSVILKSNTHEFCATASPHATDPPYAGLAYLYRYMPGCTCTTTSTPNPYNGQVAYPSGVASTFTAPLFSTEYTGTVADIAAYLNANYKAVTYTKTDILFLNDIYSITIDNNVNSISDLTCAGGMSSSQCAGFIPKTGYTIGNTYHASGTIGNVIAASGPGCSTVELNISGINPNTISLGFDYSSTGPSLPSVSDLFS
ncbi:MAG: hypothetical protein JST76_11295, partial [Bacteroidetes bacterium]|nr:hypothetical protein [Bacteroidota bacterium]